MKLPLYGMDNAVDKEFWDNTMRKLKEVGPALLKDGFNVSAGSPTCATELDTTPPSWRTGGEAGLKPLASSSPKTLEGKAPMSRLQKLKAFDLRLNLSSEELKMQKNADFQTRLNEGCNDV